MYTDYTWQDWKAAHLDTAEPVSKVDTIRRVINEYKASADFQDMLEANLYFYGESPVIDKKTILKAKVITVQSSDGVKHNKIENDEIAGNRIASSFLVRFISQQVQYLLGNGVSLEDADVKKQLGRGFDRQLQRVAEQALLHGVSWAFWNKDHLETISACNNRNSGFVALLDEFTSQPMVGIQFWKVADKKPLHVRLFEPDGYTYYLEKDGILAPDKKKPYLSTVYTDAAGEMELEGQNYAQLPIFALYANDQAKSELTPSIKSKIDLYDRVLSDFGDNLDRSNDVYWVLNNFTGDVSTITSMFEYINKLKTVINQNDGMGNSSAEPRTIEVPYAAREKALEILRKALYADYMALDTSEITGGSLTNVAIKAAYSAMDLKATRFEWQCFGFVQKILTMLGINTEQIRFVRASITNDQEVIANIYQMRSDIDHHTALRLNPYIMEEEIDTIIQKVDQEGQTGYADVEQLEKDLEEEDEPEGDA